MQRGAGRRDDLDLGDFTVVDPTEAHPIHEALREMAYLSSLEGPHRDIIASGDVTLDVTEEISKDFSSFDTLGVRTGVSSFDFPPPPTDSEGKEDIVSPQRRSRLPVLEDSSDGEPLPEPITLLRSRGELREKLKLEVSPSSLA